MRIMIKGGVWKNTEDEILKAAVMKYGKNQWARISSLLVRKSAKQCKARWYEWLDPSIKKTEWTREEDEKLLHLARLMPTQWRTIAPIVGRTPSQCLERYEKLLDAACAKDENYEPSDDPRKLRPGEIDPNPESKPARPDPVDMDEDEKEMLSEARARLANTRGKKAKRKAREKQLEEARRLASLQKRRELKAAGIQTRLRKRKRRGIDYNAEIPFEKRPPPGFFDTVDEERPAEQPKFPTTIEELEGKRRADVEAQLRKQDVARNKIAQRQDAPSAILQANKLNDPEAVRKRAKLMLPPPQISDHELEEIAKMGYASDLLSGNDDLAQGSGATRALLANYSQTPRLGLTSLRTPQRTPGGNVDTVMMEAENLARLREAQTPLLGGDNPELHPSDFSGVTPRKKEIRTPNPMATPLVSPGPMGLTPRIGMTPSRDGYSVGMTPRGTPMRDELHINEDMDLQDNAKLELRRQAELKRNFRSGLSSLPQPSNEYQIVIRPTPEEPEELEEKIEEDMSDRIARENAEEQARQEALLKKRSKVLQRELPRPPVASLDILRNLLMRVGEDKSSFVPPTPMEQSDEMINKELLALLEHDNAKYPLDEKSEKDKKKGGRRASNGKSAVYIPEIEDFDQDELKEADSLIKEEIMHLRVAMGHESESLDDFVKARDACQEDLMYFPARSTYGLASVAGTSEKLESLQNEFENLRTRLDEEAKKATKAEQKIKVLTQGYQTRAGKLWSQIEATFKQMDSSATELECFEALKKQEHLAASYRVNYLIGVVKKQRELENTLQRRYGDLLAEHARVEQLVQEHRLQLRIQEEIAARNRALEEERVRKEQALLEEEMARKEQARLEEEKLHKEQALLEEEMARKEQALLEEERARNEQALLEEKLRTEKALLEEEMVRKEQTLLEEERARNEQALLEEEMARKEQARLEDERVCKEQALLEEEMVHTEHEQGRVCKEHDLHEEEMAHKEQTHPEEEMVHKEHSLLEEEMPHKEHACLKEETMRKELVCPEEETLHIEQSLLEEESTLRSNPLEIAESIDCEQFNGPVETVPNDLPMSTEPITACLHNEQSLFEEGMTCNEHSHLKEEKMRKEKELFGEEPMCKEHVCPNEEMMQSNQSRLEESALKSNALEVAEFIDCEQFNGPMETVPNDLAIPTEPVIACPVQDTHEADSIITAIDVDESSLAAPIIAEHGNAIDPTAVAELLGESDISMEQEICISMEAIISELPGESGVLKASSDGFVTSLSHAQVDVEKHSSDDQQSAPTDQVKETLEVEAHCGMVVEDTVTEAINGIPVTTDVPGTTDDMVG